MAAISGRKASIKLATSLVAGLGKWDLTLSRKEIDTTEFGDDWEKSEVGMANWKATFSGHLDLDDAQQETLRGYFDSGDLIQDVRFYLNNDTGKYYAPDTVTDPDAGGRLTQLKIGHSKDGVASAEFSISGSGPITLN
jgi:predicted secreted protein